MSDSVINVRVSQLVGPLCVSMRDGERLYEKIFPHLEKGVPINLSFEHVEVIISAFLNSAIGQLYGKLPYDRVDHLISCSGLESDDQDLLERVIQNAKLYYERPEDFDRVWTEELGDEGETE